MSDFVREFYKQFPNAKLEGGGGRTWLRHKLQLRTAATPSVRACATT